MCLICVEMLHERLTSHEARRNLGEIKSTIPKEHIIEVYQAIRDKENEEKEALWLDDEQYGDTD